ncbi:ribosome silencing factor [Candidatus Blochmannia ocreatus (nom. nud.)]|uniref:Ribosomal silencing factor RsfS n=1 Tax=Candidatus Blochmannia ocreatus (nom. nud.) TaxID=251538 RepID=A0ABY4STR7_9ENTR|nr:ribosome silencing factor [Candidatus Blochmannia ocreatus]URJ25370.1 ribosome silencing factor [Candidatus Blochmannia ocreatus]
MQSDILKDFLIDMMSIMQGKNIVFFDMHNKSSITDIMIICTGTSSRHVISISQGILRKSRGIGVKPYGTEGIATGEWVLVDLGDVIVHIMQEEIRKKYELEKLWS